ncbi:MAG TPA: phosphoribosyltransferase family protein [Bacillota bacterium]|nr:phosphoribosyltransferase family protein [Bacillota bacterium]
MLFIDRVDAGRRLGRRLARIDLRDPLVLAVPRGGAVVGAQVARELGAPLDLIIPRKIGAPHNEELAVGAVAPDGTLYRDERLIRGLAVPEDFIEQEAGRQLAEVQRRMLRYRGERALPNLSGRAIILVDDGIATGATVAGALLAIRRQRPAHVLLAVPVAPRETLERLAGQADRIVCLASPEPFYAVGQFYQVFAQVTDEEVIRLLTEFVPQQ